MSRTVSVPSQAPDARLPDRAVSRVHVAASYCAAYVVLGLMLTCIGPSLDALKGQTGSTTEAIALLFAANAVGYIVGSLLAGRVYGRLPGNRMLAGALLILALLTATVPAVRSLPVLLVVFGLIGVPLGLMDVGGNTLLVWLFRDEVAPYMNALHLSFGVGALVGPLVFDRVAVATGDAALTFWPFAALMIPVALWLASLPTPESPPEAGIGESAAILRRHAWLVGLIAMFFFMHMGAELAFGGWIYSYAQATVASGTAARVLNSVFWAGLVLGRIVAVPLAVRLSPPTMLQLDLLGAVASLTVIVLLRDSEPALWIATIGFGFSIASLIPSSFNLAAGRMPITGQVSAAFLVGGSLGTMTLPWLVGQVFVPYGPLSVMYVTVAAMVAAWVLFLAIVRRRPRADERGLARGRTSPA